MRHIKISLRLLGFAILIVGLYLVYEYWPARMILTRQASEPTELINRLGQEKSPYLLQHKDNPVAWYAWGEAAFAAARAQNKPIFLSIGYSTCYWCHVMEKDSFERQEVADVLNAHFISIKVDREERPDVDKIYMDAVVSMRRRGGWPLSVFLTPDLKPFFGGTYFPRQTFLKILDKIQSQWWNNPETILESGNSIAQLLERLNSPRSDSRISDKLFRQAFTQFQSSFDETDGGFGRAPKFPQSMKLSLLLRMHRRSGNAEALNMVTKTLDAMAHGGMYDHLGGGFHRYSTDTKWHVPHFEKMLYDNALLAWTYLEAYQVTHQEDYAQIARATLDYVLRDMTSPEGAFYSAQDAGEVDREGEFYIWTDQELRQSLSPEEYQQFKQIYAIRPNGNFEHGHNILYLAPGQDWQQTQTPQLKSARQKLLAIRTQRPHPHKDDKTLTAWNGLMIAALAKGYQVLGEERYHLAAEQSAQFIRKQLTKKSQLLRRYRDGESRVAGTLNDYAYLIHGLLVLYQSRFDLQWLKWAQALQDSQDKLLWDAKNGGYFFSIKDDPSLLVRQKEFDEGAIPAGNGVALLNLLQLYNFTFQRNYQEKAKQLMKAASGFVSRSPFRFAQTLIGLDYYLDRSKEVAIIGAEDVTGSQAILRFFHQTFLPNKVLALTSPDIAAKRNALPLLQKKKMIDDKTTVYVCEDKLCKQPTTELKEVMELMNDIRAYEL